MLLTDYKTTDAQPVWMAALLATDCLVQTSGGARKVAWQCVAGRAVYSNSGAETIVLLPFGVRVRGGASVIVSWLPGETGYTIELQPHRLAA